MITPTDALPPVMPFTLQITVMSSPFATVAVNAGEFPSRTAAFAGATVMVTALGVGGGSGGGPKKLGGTAEPTAAQPHRYAAIPCRRQTDSSGPKSARRIFSMTVEIVLVIFLSVNARPPDRGTRGYRFHYRPSSWRGGVTDPRDVTSYCEFPCSTCSSASPSSPC
jgi:hypothetical protein